MCFGLIIGNPLFPCRIALVNRQSLNGGLEMIYIEYGARGFFREHRLNLHPYLHFLDFAFLEDMHEGSSRPFQLDEGQDERRLPRQMLVVIAHHREIRYRALVAHLDPVLADIGEVLVAYLPWRKVYRVAGGAFDSHDLLLVPDGRYELAADPAGEVGVRERHLAFHDEAIFIPF